MQRDGHKVMKKAVGGIIPAPSLTGRPVGAAVPNPKARVAALLAAKARAKAVPVGPAIPRPAAVVQTPTAPAFKKGGRAKSR